MDVLALFTSGQLPLFNRLALLPINFITAALVLTVVNHNKLKNYKSRVFVALSMLILTWVDFAYLARRIGATSSELSDIFLRIAWVATPPVFYFSYLLSLILLGRDKEYKLVSRVLLAVTLVFSALTAFTRLIIVGHSFDGVNLDIVYGIGFLPFLGFILVLMFLTLIPLFRSRLNNAKISFLIGLIIFYIANFIFNISLPVIFKVTHLYYFGDYSTIFLVVFTTYSIIRHKLFDIKVFATEVLIVVIWSVLLMKLLITQTLFETGIDAAVLVAMVFLGIMLIRSVRREVEQKDQLTKLTSRLKEIDSKKDEFLNVAAHELRAPMTAIKGYLSMARDGDGGKIPAQAGDFLREAAEETDRLIRLVNNMLNISRIEENRLVFDMGDARLGEVVSRVFNEQKYSADEKKLSYKLEIQKGIEDMVVVDIDRIYEVVSNLINNSVKYTDQGSVKVKLCNPIVNKIRFEVTDTGLGLSEDEQTKLFEKFYRAESNIGKKIGTGLGLYVSRLLIEKFHGEIGFKSEKNKGSTFWFELPLKK